VPFLPPLQTQAERSQLGYKPLPLLRISISDSKSSSKEKVIGQHCEERHFLSIKEVRCCFCGTTDEALSEDAKTP